MYLVFVCPKCKLSAQILEPGHKTVSCHRCNSQIKTDSLRFFGTFEKREQAVSMRTIIQAQICSSPDGLPVDISGNFPAKPAAELPGSFSVPAGADVKTAPPKIKRPDRIIFEVLQACGIMTVSDCEYYCAERGVDGETFKKTLQKMIEAGLVYRPDKGRIALV
ncbi:MAG: hypothetical protein FWE78_03185 [Methanimicrococcus sp.]|nr:hypothetical protein [Methanimicrococcus sp.]